MKSHDYSRLFPKEKRRLKTEEKFGKNDWFFAFFWAVKIEQYENSYSLAQKIGHYQKSNQVLLQTAM